LHAFQLKFGAQLKNLTRRALLNCINQSYYDTKKDFVLKILISTIIFYNNLAFKSIDGGKFI